MPTSTALIRFADVHKSYDSGVPVVAGMALDIARGELLTLLGPSGSGKTTALMMLAGFVTPDAGQILHDGRDIARTAPHRRGFGVVFQNYALFPHMTVGDNIAFPLAVRHVPRGRRQELVARALDLVKLPGIATRLPAQLSGGQQQRVALARALVFEPELVLLDEPLGALDRALREELQTEIRALQRRLGVTMLYVTHDQNEALTLSDRIAVMHRGRVQQVATPRTMYEAPSNAFVAGFIGENNRLPGVIEATEDGMATVRLTGGAVVQAVLGDVDSGPCVVAVRPEHVAVVPGSVEGLGDDALAATLTEIIYLGDHVRLRLAFTGTEIVAKRPTAGLAGFVPGQAIAMAWSPDHATAFRPEN